MEYSKEYLKAQLKREFNRWRQLKEEGGSDPFWEDGTNMNLLRNHIIYTKRLCEQKLDEKDYPTLYYRETPPEVSNTYMAKEFEIRDKARNLYNRLADVTPEDCYDADAYAQIGRIRKRLLDAFNEDKVVTMRSCLYSPAYYVREKKLNSLMAA